MGQVDYSAQILFQELRQRSYQGSYETVKLFVRPLRPCAWPPSGRSSGLRRPRAGRTRSIGGTSTTARARSVRARRRGESSGTPRSAASPTTGAFGLPLTRKVLPAAGRPVERQEVVGELVIEHAVHPRRDRRPRCDGAFAELQEPLRLRLLLGAGALADRPAVDVVLAPPDPRVIAAFSTSDDRETLTSPPSIGLPGARRAPMGEHISQYFS